MVVDALSRVKHHISSLFTYVSLPAWISEVTKSYKNYEACKKLLTELAIDTTSHENYAIAKGILKFKSNIVVRSHVELRKKLITAFQQSKLGGHSSEKGHIS